MKTFESIIIEDSSNPNGNRVTTFLLTYPRFIHSEIMTHRAFSRNAASSRAIPIEKLIEQVRTNPAMPIRWGKNGKGMQDHGSLENQESILAEESWRRASERAVESATHLHSIGLHKQIVNRVLEPFVWMTTLVTATEWENFFALRAHKDAQPELQHLSIMMLRKYLQNKPKAKNWGEWHIPFGDKMPNGLSDLEKIKVATARAARTSYLTMDGQINVDKDIQLHDSLSENGHWSPFEHSCTADSSLSIGNFKGWAQYRSLFCEQNKKCDLRRLLSDLEEDNTAIGRN